MAWHFFRENDAYYAGILAGADLGEPITAPFANASWAGKISTVAYNSWGGIDYQATLSNFDFVLDITFDGTNGGNDRCSFHQNWALLFNRWDV